MSKDDRCQDCAYAKRIDGDLYCYDVDTGNGITAQSVRADPKGCGLEARWFVLAPRRRMVAAAVDDLVKH